MSSFRWSKNMIKNPRAEDGTSDWTVSAATFEAIADGYIGDKCFNLVNGEVEQVVSGFRVQPPAILVEIAYMPFYEADVETVKIMDTQDLIVTTEYSGDVRETTFLPLRNERPSGGDSP